MQDGQHISQFCMRETTSAGGKTKHDGFNVEKISISIFIPHFDNESAAQCRRQSPAQPVKIRSCALIRVRRVGHSAWAAWTPRLGRPSTEYPVPTRDNLGAGFPRIQVQRAIVFNARVFADLGTRIPINARLPRDRMVWGAEVQRPALALDRGRLAAPNVTLAHKLQDRRPRGCANDVMRIHLVVSRPTKRPQISYFWPV